MANLLNLHKANKIENKDVEFGKLHRIVLESISVSDNFFENFKKVTKLTYRGGGG